MTTQTPTPDPQSGPKKTTPIKIQADLIGEYLTRLQGLAKTYPKEVASFVNQSRVDNKLIIGNVETDRSSPWDMTVTLYPSATLVGLVDTLTRRKQELDQVLQFLKPRAGGIVEPSVTDFKQAEGFDRVSQTGRTVAASSCPCCNPEVPARPADPSHRKNVTWEVSFNEYGGHSIKAVAEQIHLEYLSMPEHSRPAVIRVDTTGIAVQLLHALSKLGLPVEGHKPWLEKSKQG